MVDMEGDLVNALEEIDRLRLKKRKQKQLLMQYENNGKEPSEYISLLKLELVETKKIEDILKQQLTEGKNMCEVVTARKELEKFQVLYHQNMSSIKDSEELNNILGKQRSPWLKTGLGYEEGSSNKQSECEHTVQSKGILWIFPLLSYVWSQGY